jgi:hypothetical protein
MPLRMSDAQFRQLSLFKGKRQRGVHPPAPKEFSIHCMVADDLRRFCPLDWRWTHFPAGEARTETTGARLKRMGTQPGWPDFILLSPAGRFHGLELKRRGNALSDTQLAFRAWCWSHGPLRSHRQLPRGGLRPEDLGCTPPERHPTGEGGMSVGVILGWRRIGFVKDLLSTNN